MKHLFTFLFLMSCSSIQAAQIWVAPNGNDNAPGTRQRPLATPEKARDLARAQIKTGQNVEVILLGGDYQLKAPLELNEADTGTMQKPVVWRAAPKAQVRFSAGRSIANWRRVSDAALLQRLEPAARDRVWETDLKAQGIGDYGEMSGGFSKSGSTGLELFIDDAPMHVSRYPNKGFISIAEVQGASPIDVRGTKGTKEGIFRVEDKRVARWANEKDARVMGYWFWDWADERQKIANLDAEKLTITLAEPWHGSGYRKGQYFYGFNLLSEIDESGEWYLDRQSGKLYVLPPNGAPKQAMATVLPTALKLQKASHISFQNIIIEGAREHAITLNDCENVSFIGCTIRNSGKWGVRIEGGKNCAVRGAEITGLGDGGVSLSGGDRKTLTPANHVVENCHIYKYSRWNRTYQAAISLNGVGCRAVNNLIHDAPHQAMNLGGNDHVIEYNEIHNVCEETNDAGAIYGWNDWAGRGHLIRYNYLHHIYGREGEGANGVYLDDNFSSATIEGNIFEQQVRPVHLGGGRDHKVINNLFIDCKQALHIDARGLGWRTYGFDELKNKLEQWPYKTPPWSTRYPELLTLLQDEPMAPKGNIVARNIIIDSQWDDIESKAKPYVKMENNLLEAPRSLLQKGALPGVNLNAQAVRDIGFKPIPSEKIGLFKSSERAIWPVKHEVTQHQWHSSAVTQAHTMPRFRVVRVTKAPLIDGVVSPNEYNGAVLPLGETPSRDKIQKGPGAARLSHDGKRLYIAVTIPLETPGKIKGTGDWGAADAVEIVLRWHSALPATPHGPTFVLQGFADGRSIQSAAAGAPAEAMTKLQKGIGYAAKTDANSWTAEWSIPLAEAGLNFQPGLTLGFNIGARRLESDDWLVWTGTNRENWRLDGAGRIILD
jgi:hypothetical protein